MSPACNGDLIGNKSLPICAQTRKVGVLMLAHARPQLLGLIRRQVAESWSGAQVLLTVDRPTTPVLRAVNDLEGLWPTEVVEAPFPVVSDRERFPELRRWQLDRVRGWGCDYLAIWDDDHVIERPEVVIDQMRAGADLIYATKVFLWDDVRLVNRAVPDHTSVLFFKYKAGDQFPLDRIIHAPAGVHDDPASKVARGARLLDVGYLSAVERERVFKSYARAGKVDAATLSIMNEPRLTPYKGEGRWYEELKTVLR